MNIHKREDIESQNIGQMEDFKKTMSFDAEKTQNAIVRNEKSDVYRVNTDSSEEAKS